VEGVAASGRSCSQCSAVMLWRRTKAAHSSRPASTAAANRAGLEDRLPAQL